MLCVIDDLKDLDFRQLMDVYEQWNIDNGARTYPGEPMNLQILFAEQDFYYFLNDFFAVAGARYFVWRVDGVYSSALRMEPYKDGYLLEALETAPRMRRNGHASALICAVLCHISSLGPIKIYSHVAKDNAVSLKTHFNHGFAVVADHALFIDGTHHADHYTLLYENN